MSGLICGGVVAGSLLGFLVSLRALMEGVSWTRTIASPLPGLTISIGLDPLSAFFLVAIFGLSGAVGIYAWGYLKKQPRLARSLPFFPLLVAAMAAVVAARDGFFFLICWEVMSLASFFLVTAEHEIREVRHAGWIYLTATHLATAFLMVFFILLYRKTGTFSFEAFAQAGPLPPPLAGLLFVFALIGFGTKAGIFPLHIWLPHAHPAAPSYISALMSGVMIKTGIYGILRTLTFLGPPPLWWGELLIGLGILSAVLGALYALLQSDLKRLLAYSSIENIGIIVTGIGLGLIGMTGGMTGGITGSRPLLMAFGFGGALFHVWNHALLKGALFLGAGGVVHETHTRAIERMGGLLKRMPATGILFLTAALAVCGLPPLNGFLSEWLLYRGLFDGVKGLFGPPLFFMVAGIVGIALAGGLILASFTRVVGIAFLGESRDEKIAGSREISPILVVPMAVLILASVGIAAFPGTVWSLVDRVLPVLRSLEPSLSPLNTDEVLFPLKFLGIFSLFFLGLTAILIRSGRSRVREMGPREALTWDCGYAKPNPRMQYTASSFSEPLGAVFRALLKPRLSVEKPAGFFPRTGRFAEQTEDVAERRLFKPLFQAADRSFLLIRRMQQGRIQGYLALIFGALLVLLVWEVWHGV